MDTSFRALASNNPGRTWAGEPFVGALGVWLKGRCSVGSPFGKEFVRSVVGSQPPAIRRDLNPLLLLFLTDLLRCNSPLKSIQGNDFQVFTGLCGH